MKKETPLVKQYRSIKAEYPDTLLFFRLGDFYELFDEDAIEGSKLMEIALTKRQGRPMCGIPYHAASNYIRKIISKSQSVAICEQVESPSDSKGLVKREVVRVITPGTVIEDDLLKGESNNFLLSLYRDKEKYGLIFLDVSTGDFMGCSAPSASMMESEISRMPVREAVISEGDKELKEFFQTRFPSIPVTLVDSWYFTVPKASDLIKDYFSVGTLKGLEIDSLPEVVSSSGGLVAYLKDTQKKNRALFKKFRLYSLEDGMMLDRNAQENLELVKNQQDSSKKNTLFEVLDYTDTAMGRRLLHSSILRPLTDSVKIRQRLNAVEELLRETDLSMQAGESLKGMSDMERILARAGFGSCNARDLLNLKETLQAIPGLIRVLKAGEAELLKNITTQLDPLIELTDELEKALKESPPLTVKEGGIVKKGYSPDLDELIEISSGDKKWISTLEETEKKRLGIPTLKVGYNRIHGYYIEITKAHVDKIPNDYHRKQTLVNSERYITEELKMREDSILGAEERKAALEYKLFTELREKVTFHTDSLQKNASLIALIDFLRSLSLAAQRQGYIKPSVGDYDEIDIKDGRHPVVEVNMPVSGFIPNDTKLNSATEQVMIITGPNMAGKSTYLKQVAIITVMAQIGCFVPATEARIGIVDRIFTRVGSGENLAGGESTFMVEMTEVAAILNNATPRSLLIMDEVGRGTSTLDGISIAWAVIEELSKSGSRTLFATHYFELAALSEILDNVNNFNFAVREWTDRKKIVFLRKLQAGSADRSYGIHCAELAGVPDKVIRRAWEKFRELEEREVNNKKFSLREGENFSEKSKQLDFSDAEAEKYREMIRNIDLNSVAPLDLMQIVRDWQEDLKKQ